MNFVTARAQFTLADIDAMPDDGARYELLDGEMIVTPAPSGPHNEMADRLARLMEACAPAGHVVLTGYQLHLRGEQRLIPDVSVLRESAYRYLETVEAPLLVVEVLSPSNAAVDLTTKMAAYAEFGVANYWVAEPNEPAVAVLRLDPAGRYRLESQAAGNAPLVIAEPFRIETVPADLRRYVPSDAALEAHLDLTAAVRSALDLQA